MTIVGELCDSMGNDLSLGDLVEYATDQGDRTAVLVWDAEIGAVILVDVATDEADFFYEIGADAVTKVEPEVVDPPMPLVATDGRIVSAPGFVLASLPQSLIGLHYEIKGELLGHPIYVPVGSSH